MLLNSIQNLLGPNVFSNNDNSNNYYESAMYYSLMTMCYSEHFTKIISFNPITTPDIETFINSIFRYTTGNERLESNLLRSGTDTDKTLEPAASVY